MVQLLERPLIQKREIFASYPIGWFSTGRDEAARNLLTVAYERRNDLGVYIPFVFSNWERGENGKNYEERQKFVELVDSYRIPFVAISWLKFREKYGEKQHDEYGKAMQEVLQEFPNKLDVLAGFMLWVPDNVCDKRRMINLHPALPNGPKGMWQEVIWQLIKERARETGAMMHRVTCYRDRGPVVTYCRFPIIGGDYDVLWEFWKTEENKLGFEQLKLRYSDELYPMFANPLFRRIREDGKAREIPLLIHTIGEFAKGNMWFEGDLLMTKEGMTGGYDITNLVEEELRK